MLFHEVAVQMSEIEEGAETSILSGHKEVAAIEARLGLSVNIFVLHSDVRNHGGRRANWSV